MKYQHAAVWMDHREARVFRVDEGSFDGSSVSAPTHHLHRHPKGPEEARKHPEDQLHFFRDVAKALEGAEEILVVGPSTAKLQFLKYAHESEAHGIGAHIVGVETVDHPTDGQLIAYVRKYFRAADKMRPITA